VLKRNDDDIFSRLGRVTNVTDRQTDRIVIAIRDINTDEIA